MKKGLAQEGSQAPCTKWAWALLAAVLLFIWGNSLLPPSWSWRVSGVVQEAVEQVLPVEQADGVLGQVKGFTVRKLAHMSEFALLGALLALLTGAFRRRDRVALMLLLGLLTALLDVLFAVGALLETCGFLFLATRLDVRLYALLGAACGVTLYRFGLQPALDAVVSFLQKQLSKFVQKHVFKEIFHFFCK